MGGRQAGFVHSSIMDLAFLLLMILLALGVWNWFSALIGGDFMLAWFMVWLMAAAVAWWRSKDQLLVLRLPAGTLVFVAASLLLLPLSWWSENKLVTGAEAAAGAVLAPYLGKLWSGRLVPRLQPTPPWYLQQSVNLLNDLFRWGFACIIAWFVVGVLPLVFIFVLPAEWILWAALPWAFVALTWYLLKIQPSRIRILKLPLGLWAMAAAALVLQLSQRLFAGSLEPGSIAQLSYLVYLPTTLALATEMVLIGKADDNSRKFAASSAETA